MRTRIRRELVGRLVPVVPDALASEPLMLLPEPLMLPEPVEPLMLPEPLVPVPVVPVDPPDTDGSTVPAALPLVRVLSLIAPDEGLIVDEPLGEVLIVPEPIEPGAPVVAAAPGVPVPVVPASGVPVPVPVVPVPVVPVPVVPVPVVPVPVVPVPVVPVPPVPVVPPGERVVSPGSEELGAGLSGERVVSPVAGEVVGGCEPDDGVPGLVVGVPGLDGLVGVVWAAAAVLPSMSARPAIKVRCIIRKSPWGGAPGPLREHANRLGGSATRRSSSEDGS